MLCYVYFATIKSFKNKLASKTIDETERHSQDPKSSMWLRECSMDRIPEPANNQDQESRTRGDTVEQTGESADT